MKKVAIKIPAAANAWVSTRDLPEPIVSMKRFTIDVSEDLHRRIKIQCAEKSLKMADVIREILERDFPENHKN